MSVKRKRLIKPENQLEVRLTAEYEALADPVPTCDCKGTICKGRGFSDDDSQDILF